MTTPTDHQRPIHLINGPLPTALSFSRFLVTWRDVDTQQDRALGDLVHSRPATSSSPKTGGGGGGGQGTQQHRPELFFRIAWDAASGALLLYFYLPLKMRATAKGTRDVYLVVAAEGIEALEMPGEGREGREATHQHGADDDTEKKTEDKANAEAVLRVRVSLCSPSSVLMPTAGAKRPLSTQSRGLLLSLKSLAQAPGFEVALPYSRRLQDVLRDVVARRAANAALHTPQLDHEKTFSGRAWAVAPWERYLLDEGERLQGAWNPVVDEAPPAYWDVCGGDAGAGLEVRDVEEGGAGAGRQEASLRDSAGERQGQREEEEKGESPVGIREAQTPTQQTTSIFPPLQLKAAPAAQDRTQQTTKSSRPALKRKAASPPPATRSTHPAAPITTSALLHTLHIYLSPSTPPGALASQLPLPPHSHSVLHLGRSRMLFSDAQFACFFNGVAWLASVWPRRPDAHLALLSHCGRMMQCVRRSDAARFAEQRVEAMAAALALPADRQDNGDRDKERHGDSKRQKRERLGTRSPFDTPPTQAGARLVQFVYFCVGEGVDAFIVDDLLALQEVAVLLERAAAAAGLCRRDGDAKSGLHTALQRASDEAVVELERQAVAFTFQMAACVMLALFKAHERDWFKGDGMGGRRGGAVGV